MLANAEAKAFVSLGFSCPWNCLGTRQKGSCNDHHNPRVLEPRMGPTRDLPRHEPVLKVPEEGLDYLQNGPENLTLPRDDTGMSEVAPGCTTVGFLSSPRGAKPTSSSPDLTSLTWFICTNSMDLRAARTCHSDRMCFS